MKQNFIALYSGAGIGLLIGVLMGLAVSPTVGIIIGALASSLALILGLNDKHFSNAKAIRIGSFGFACVLGALLGIFIRTNSLLAPNLKSQYEKYREIGFEHDEALDFIAYERFGILNKDWKIYSSTQDSTNSAGNSGQSTPSAAELVHRGSFVGLYSAEVNESDCENLNSLGPDDSLPLIFQRFETTGTFWKGIVAGVETEIQTNDQKSAMLAIRDGFCKSESKTITDADCEKLKDFSPDASTEEMISYLNDNGGTWKSLSESISNGVSKKEQKKLILILAKNACHEKK
jgi:hypothetical protein